MSFYFILLIVTCWPSPSGNGCDVNIEYELQNTSLELTDVVIMIPFPHVLFHHSSIINYHYLI